MDEERLVDALEQALLDQAVRSAGLIYAAPYGAAEPDRIRLEGDFDLRELARALKSTFDG